MPTLKRRAVAKAVKSALGTVDTFFREEKDSIAESNWHNLRYMTLVYLASQITYYFVVCLPQGVEQQTHAVLLAIAVQAVYSLVVWLRREIPPARTIQTYLIVFSAFVMTLVIWLGTAVFSENNALLFPLVLIMMTLFYTLHPLVLLALLGVYVVTFLAASFAVKPYGIFLLDVLSTVISLVISLLSVYTSNRSKIEISQKQRELNFLCEFDPLTKALNKAGFLSKYKGVTKNLPHGGRITLAMVDIDRFKSINDTYGHLFGDKVLQRFTTLLEQHFFDDSTNIYIGRFGGDEFVVLIENDAAADNDGAQFREFLSKTEIICMELKADVTCSIGIVVADYDPNALEPLLEVADTAMYTIKQSGGASYKMIVQ